MTFIPNINEVICFVPCDSEKIKSGLCSCHNRIENNFIYPKEKLHSSRNLNPDMENVKMFLFARWIATCYADEHLDNNMKSEYEEGYNRDNELSILNRETGYWYKEQLDHFNKVVYPNYIENGTVENTKRFFEI